MKCEKMPKFIEIFALNNFFIDADIDHYGKEIQLSIIASNWEIIGDRKIMLNGVPGKSHVRDSAANGDNSNFDGKPGIPGNSGSSAGCFLAIGDKFINDKNLKVHLSGGSGAPGQNGGNGL